MTNLEVIEKVRIAIDNLKFRYKRIDTEYLVEAEQLEKYLNQLENEILVETAENILEEHKEAFQKLSE